MESKRVGWVMMNGAKGGKKGGGEEREADGRERKRKEIRVVKY